NSAPERNAAPGRASHGRAEWPPRSAHRQRSRRPPLLVGLPLVLLLLLLRLLHRVLRLHHHVAQADFLVARRRLERVVAHDRALDLGGLELGDRLAVLDAGSLEDPFVVPEQLAELIEPLLARS